MSLPANAPGGGIYRAMIDRVEEQVISDEWFDVISLVVDEITSESRSAICIVKCDVEGHEVAVLRGAKQLLSTGLASWWIEVAGQPESSASAAMVFETFARHGFVALVVEGNELRERVPADNPVNYLFVSPDGLLRWNAKRVAHRHL